MLNFPKNTEINKFLAKEKLMDKLDLSAALKESLKNDVRRFTITHELSEKSINIPKGENVAAIFVIEITLKRRDIDYKLIEAVAKQNPRKILFVLRYENDSQLAIFCGKLYKTDWLQTNEPAASITGLNLDEVWDDLVARIAMITETDGEQTAPVAERLARREELQKLMREIGKLEAKARNERQPKKKFELVGRINILKKLLEDKKFEK